ncbi:BRO1-domain-containing protein [Laetiporus sulphureus 93-53]|uniref:BRO1-domain-containing protein n=1 Tax=Laetiporus sulphureus 93-53 TaxID=1314785 RepID=A0A165EUV2_9APHY|nr:BRO1-domain-containing protein [Laetiporus sulphureus 93-53]KZT07808.1 BRO1-domain-containing protein [Laetiporus sulphureus 93-53]
MPNQLSVPFKRTHAAELRQAVKEYLLMNRTETHPDAFRWDINRWEALRKDGVGGVVHVDRVKAVLSYHAQLVFILTKLPPDIGLEISYSPAFDLSAPPIMMSNLQYERAAVLFNLGSLYSQLASSQDRSTSQGLKQAIVYYQNAAGTWKYLAESAIPQFKSSLPPNDLPLELSEAFAIGLEFLMLGQAQECVWQRAVMDNYKNGLIAKLAIKVSSFYGASLSTIREASPSIRHVFPPHWLAHIETKKLHFEAVAQYRKSVDDIEANRYGYEISRLTQAQLVAKRGYDVARRGSVAQAVLHDIKSLLDNVQKSLARAERDNDLIYHQDVPSASALPPIQEAEMAKPITPPGLTDPKTAIGEDAVIFGELLGWGAKVAIDIYHDRLQNWLKDEVTDRAQQLDDSAHRLLEALNLPTALEALDKPIGLPPSLIKKAEEVRLENGPGGIETSIEGVRKLAQQAMNILNEALDVLDHEAEEDEDFQVEYYTERSPSSEANKDLITKAQRYRTILEQAAESDQVVRQKWDEWERNIVELTWDESELEASVPSSTFPPSQRSSARGANPTQVHARALRVLLESLDDLIRTRADYVRRATRLAESEDIRPRILKAAAEIERWVEVQPSMFEDVIEEEMVKYDKFRVGVQETEQKQGTILESIKERNSQLLQSRKEDPSVKEREHALQSLDLAYHKYKEIRRNLDEGLKFYSEFSNVLSQFRETCKDWVIMRRNEMNDLVRAVESLSMRQVPSAPATPVTQQACTTPAEPEEPAPTRPQAMGRGVLDLPPPDSDEWETMALPPAPKTPMRMR